MICIKTILALLPIETSQLLNFEICIAIDYNIFISSIFFLFENWQISFWLIAKHMSIFNTPTLPSSFTLTLLVFQIIFYIFILFPYFSLILSHEEGSGVKSLFGMDLLSCRTCRCGDSEERKGTIFSIDLIYPDSKGFILLHTLLYYLLFVFVVS